jgi:Calcineurin-like phosphoesterase
MVPTVRKKHGPTFVWLGLLVLLVLLVLLASSASCARRDSAVKTTPERQTAEPRRLPGVARRRVARFVHMTDLHVIDDESPARVTKLDDDGSFRSASRPQEGFQCRIVNAAARTVRRLHADAPIDLVVLSGDVIDDAQENELTWFVHLMEGGTEIACDSGVPDDPVPGPDNDGKDPFLAVGTGTPWYLAAGNHDLLVQGSFPTGPMERATALGTNGAGGTRDYAKAGAPSVEGTVIADPRRKLLDRATLVDRVGAAHVPGAYAQRHHKTFFTVDIPSSPVRLVALDTAAETGGALGLVRREDIDAFLIPELARAATDGKWLVFFAHHAVDAIGDGRGSSGVPQPGALSSAEYAASLTTSPNAIASLAGHAHQHRVRRIGKEPRAIWEIETSSLVDFPGQLRVVEIWDEDNGFGTIRSTVLDYATDDDAVAAKGRALMLTDGAAGGGWGGRGEPEDRNVVLWFEKPRASAR